MESLKIMLVCIAAAVLYGIVHDQFTARICVEYFSVFHPPIFGTQSPTLLALGWGIVATWWVGAILGVLLAVAARAGSRPKLPVAALLSSIGKLLFLMAGSALLFGLAGYLLAQRGMIAPPDWIASSLTPSTHARFMADWWAHGASYAIGFVGGVVLCVVQYRKRVGNSIQPNKVHIGLIRGNDVKKQNTFESIFKEFVTEFGGEILQESSVSRTADYFFRGHNIIAELKCLMKDQTDAMNTKVASIVQDWVRRNKKLPPGSIQGDQFIYEIKNQPKEIQDAWLAVLRKPVEDLVGAAHGQIRDTKELLNLSSAKGLVLIFNDNNVLHNSPKDYARLIATVVRKRTPEGVLRYPHIQGVVYFSFVSVKARDEGMSFWLPIQVKNKMEDDASDIEQFQLELREGWYAFVGKKFGKPVRQHPVP
jgi:hypothetical protein